MRNEEIKPKVIIGEIIKMNLFAVHAGFDFVNKNLSNSLRYPLKSETDEPIKFNDESPNSKFKRG